MPRPVAALTELLRISPAGVDLDRFALAAGMTPREAQGAWRETEARVLKAEVTDTVSPWRHRVARRY
jgi:hypothetical protein